MILKKLIQEAYQPEKVFGSEEELVSKVKSILRRVSFPRAKTIKSKGTEKGFSQPTKFGYTYRFFNGNITISFVGTEPNWITELMKDFTQDKIVFHYNAKTEVFLVKSDDNVKLPEENYPINVKEELDSGSFNVLGAIASGKYEIRKIINAFSPEQKEIYHFLLDNDMVEWKFLKQNNKYVYQLMKIN